MSKPRARRVVSRVDARPTRYAPIPSEPDRAPEAQEEAEMAEWGESKSASDAPVVNNPRPAPKGDVNKDDASANWHYGGIAYPVLPDPPKPVLKVFREHVVTGEIEFKDVPDPDPDKPDLPHPTAKQVWGLEPMPGAEPTPAA